VLLESLYDGWLANKIDTSPRTARAALGCILRAPSALPAPREARPPDYQADKSEDPAGLRQVAQEHALEVRNAALSPTLVLLTGHLSHLDQHLDRATMSDRERTFATARTTSG